MAAWQFVLPKGKGDKEKMLQQLWSDLRTGELPGRKKEQQQQPRSAPQPEWSCPKCKTTNWMSRITCRQCKESKDAPAKANRKTRSPRNGKSPAPPLPPPKPSADEDMDVESAADGSEMFADLPIGELKQEAQRMEMLLKTLKSSRLDTEEVQERLDCLKKCIRSKLSTGQQLDSLSAQLRKQVKSREALEQQKDDMLKKLRELNIKLDDAKAMETTITKQLEEAKQALAPDTLLDGDTSSDMIQQQVHTVCEEFSSKAGLGSDTQSLAFKNHMEHALKSLAARLIPDPAQKELGKGMDLTGDTLPATAEQLQAQGLAQQQQQQQQQLLQSPLGPPPSAVATGDKAAEDAENAIPEGYGAALKPKIDASPYAKPSEKK